MEIYCHLILIALTPTNFPNSLKHYIITLKLNIFNLPNSFHINSNLILLSKLTEKVISYYLNEYLINNYLPEYLTNNYLTEYMTNNYLTEYLTNNYLTEYTTNNYLTEYLTNNYLMYSVR